MKKKEKNIFEKWANLEFGTSVDLIWLFELVAVFLLSVYVFNDMFSLRAELIASGYPNPEKVLRSFRDLGFMFFVCA